MKQKYAGLTESLMLALFLLMTLWAVSFMLGTANSALFQILITSLILALVSFVFLLFAPILIENPIKSAFWTTAFFIAITTLLNIIFFGFNAAILVAALTNLFSFPAIYIPAKLLNYRLKTACRI